MGILRKLFRAFINFIGDAICFVIEPMSALVDAAETEKHVNKDKLVVVVKRKNGKK